MGTWQAEALGALAVLATGLPLRRSDAEVADEGHVQIASVGNLHPDGLRPPFAPGPIRSMLRQKELERAELLLDDVVVTARGAAFRAALVTNEESGLIANHTLIRIRPDGLLSGPAIFAALQTPRIRSEVERLARGSTATTSWLPADLGTVRIPVPPAEVQERLRQLIALDRQHRGAAAEAIALRNEAVVSALTAVFFEDDEDDTAC